MHHEFDTATLCQRGQQETRSRGILPAELTHTDATDLAACFLINGIFVEHDYAEDGGELWFYAAAHKVGLRCVLIGLADGLHLFPALFDIDIIPKYVFEITGNPVVQGAFAKCGRSRRNVPRRGHVTRRKQE